MISFLGQAQSLLKTFHFYLTIENRNEIINPNVKNLPDWATYVPIVPVVNTNSSSDPFQELKKEITALNDTMKELLQITKKNEEHLRLIRLGTEIEHPSADDQFKCFKP